MPDLKLIALDADDLAVLSAHLQDAVVRVVDLAYLPREKRFATIANRFDWEVALGPAPGVNKKGASRYLRRRTGLRFERVLSAKVQGVDLKDKKAVLSLLALTFTPKNASETPEGDVTLTFSGGAAIRLEVECLEAEMKDLGAAWAAKISPQHPED